MYKDIEDFEKVREKQPYDIIFNKTFNVECSMGDHEFEEKFLKYFNAFIENPCVFNLVELHNCVIQNANFNYLKYFNSSFLEIIVSFLKADELTTENADIILHFIIALLELPNSEFGYRLCDLGLIEVLCINVQKSNEFWVESVVCLALLQKNNFDNHKKTIFDLMLKPVLKSLDNMLTPESVQSSLLFLYAACENQKLSKKNRSKIFTRLTNALQISDFLSIFYTVKSIKVLVDRFSKGDEYNSDNFCTGKAIMGLATLIPEPPFEADQNSLIILGVLDAIESMELSHYSFCWNFSQIIAPRMIPLLESNNDGIVIRTLYVFKELIRFNKDFSYYELGILDHLSRIIVESPIKVKNAAFEVFCVLIIYPGDDMILFLEDSKIIDVLGFIYELSGPLFSEFVKSLRIAIEHLDQTASKALENLADLEVVKMITEVMDETDFSDDKDRDEIETNVKFITEVLNK